MCEMRRIIVIPFKIGIHAAIPTNNAETILASELLKFGCKYNIYSTILYAAIINSLFWI